MDYQAGALRTARFLSIAAIIGVIAYILLDIIAQSLPPHYSPIHQVESDLAVGPYGTIMRINFVVRAFLSLALIFALTRCFDKSMRPRAGLVFFSIWAVGSGLLAFFNTDILDDKKLVPVAHVTKHGEMHLILAMFAFIAGAIGSVMIANALGRSPILASARRISTVVAWLSVVSFLLMLVGMKVHRIGGLLERVYILMILVWVVIMAAQVLTRTRAESAP